MRYAPYPAYKKGPASFGLGDIPSHWIVSRSDAVLTTERRQLPPHAFGAETVFHYSIPSVQETGTGTVEEGVNIASAKQVITGPVVLVSRLNPRRATVCFAEPADLLTLCSSEFVLLKPMNCDRIFLYYFVLSEPFRQRLDATVQSATRSHQRAAPDQIYRFHAAWPPLSEQQLIGDFLNAQSTKIDTLVLKKRTLIERLKEKRAALISRTVTRGLPLDVASVAGCDPCPSLSASGIEWIGDVPEHWAVKPIKFVAHVGNGSTPSRDNVDYWSDGTYPWLNSSVVNQEQVTEASEFVTSLALQECHLPRIKPPAVLIGITGQGKTRGMATTLQIEATINQHLAYLTPAESTLDARYLRRVLDRAYMYLRSESDGGGSTKGALTCEQIACMKVPIPPLAEQRAIADYLDRETAKIDRLVAKVEAAIDRLQEYRAALITAAVTGKIDVRDAATREDAA